MPLILDINTRFQRTIEKSKNISSGKLICKQLTHIVDAEIIRVYETLKDKLDINENFCIIPIGGYGRMELCPYSDIDILYLFEDLDDSVLSEVISKINNFLYDSGKEVGHSCRTVEECSQYMDDIKSFYAMVDARYLVGSIKLFQRFKNEILQNLPKDKLKEYNQSKIELLEKIISSDTPLLITEPNIKNGPLGLRDIQSIYWLEKTIHQIPSLSGLGIIPIFSDGQVQLIEEAYDFLLKVRIALHSFSKKKNDRLDLTLQPEISKVLGFRGDFIVSMESMVKTLFLHQKHIFYFISNYLGYIKNLNSNELQEFSFMNLQLRRDNDNLYTPFLGNPFSNPETLYKDILNTLYAVQKFDLNLSPLLIAELKFASNFIEEDFMSSKIVIEIFLNIIRSVHNAGKILTYMHECGILGKLFPEFEACKYFPLFSYHHEYPVDEHTLFILRKLDKLTSGKFEDMHIQFEYNKCEKVEILILAILIHDAGKVKDGDHSQYGAELANAIGERLGLSEEDIYLFRFLIEHHVTMSDLSSKRDISDPSLIKQFASLVGDENRLRLLYILTIIDTLAVGKNILTNWKKSILQSLFNNTLSYFQSTHESESSKAEKILEFVQNFMAQKERLPESELIEFKKYAGTILPKNYISFNTPRRIYHQYKIFKTYIKTGKLNLPIIEFEHDPAFITMTVYSSEDKFLLSYITGTVSSEGLNLIGMRTFRNEEDFCIHQVLITDSLGSAEIGDEKLARLKDHLIQVIQHQLDVEDIINSHAMWLEFNKVPEGIKDEKVKYNNEVSDEYTIFEVKLSDSLGLLYRITKAILSFDVQIHFARVSTSADYAYDSFYLKLSNGHKIDDKELLKKMSELILNASNVKAEIE